MAIRLLLRYFWSSILTSWHSPLAFHTPLGFPCHRGNEQGRLGWRLNPWSKGCIQTRMIDQVVPSLELSNPLLANAVALRLPIILIASRTASPCSERVILSVFCHATRRMRLTPSHCLLPCPPGLALHSQFFLASMRCASGPRAAACLHRSFQQQRGQCGLHPPPSALHFHRPVCIPTALLRRVAPPIGTNIFFERCWHPVSNHRPNHLPISLYQKACFDLSKPTNFSKWLLKLIH